MTMIAGAQTDRAYTSGDLTAGRGFTIGERLVEHNGKEWVFLQATTAVTGAGYIVKFDEAYAADMLSTSNDARGDLVGIPNCAVGSGEYFWAQVKGPSSVLCVAATATNTRLNATATAGQLDDNGSAANGVEVENIFVTTSSASSAAGLNPCILNYPIQGAAI